MEVLVLLGVATVCLSMAYVIKKHPDSIDPFIESTNGAVLFMIYRDPSRAAERTSEQISLMREAVPVFFLICGIASLIAVGLQILDYLS